MRLLIGAAGWTGASVLLALLFGRAVRASGVHRGVADEVEAYLRARSGVGEPVTRHAAGFVLACTSVVLVLVLSTRAIEQMPPARIADSAGGPKIGLAAPPATVATGRAGAVAASKPRRGADRFRHRRGTSGESTVTIVVAGAPTAAGPTATASTVPAAVTGPPADVAPADDPRPSRTATSSTTSTTTAPQYAGDVSPSTSTTSTTAPPSSTDPQPATGTTTTTTTTTAPPETTTTTTTTPPPPADPPPDGTTTSGG